MKRRVCNPYLPSYEYVPDGEPHVFGDRLYVFGSHDRFDGWDYCLNDYVCWSAPTDDLSDWRFEGVIYRRTQDPWPVSKEEHYMWAPDVMRGADGRYYLYYAFEWLNRIGVAVADAPAGPYEFYGEVCYPDGTRYGGRPMETLRFDPGVLNDDGRFYLYTGFSCSWLLDIARRRKFNMDNLGNAVVELEPDMKTIRTGPTPLIPGSGNSRGTGYEGHEIFEASSMRKFDGKYYAVYSSVRGRELCWAVSDYPDRDFRYGGVLHDNGNVFDESEPTIYWGNNHGGLERVNGQFYVFGHRQTHKNEFSRQGVAEPIRFENGKFLQAEMTSQGLYGKPLPCEGGYEAGIVCYLRPEKGVVKISEKRGNRHPYITQDGEDRECDPGQYIANVRSGTVFGYRYFEVPAGGADLTLTLRLHRANGTLRLAYTPEFQTSLSAEITGDTVRFRLTERGKQGLYFRYEGKGSIDVMTLEFGKAGEA